MLRNLSCTGRRAQVSLTLLNLCPSLKESSDPALAIAVFNLGEAERYKHMKKLELSEPVSHFLVFSSVLLAFLPFLLGDQLILIANSLWNEGAILIDQFRAYFLSLL